MDSAILYYDHNCLLRPDSLHITKRVVGRAGGGAGGGLKFGAPLLRQRNIATPCDCDSNGSTWPKLGKYIVLVNVGYILTLGTQKSRVTGPTVMAAEYALTYGGHWAEKEKAPSSWSRRTLELPHAIVFVERPTVDPVYNIILKSGSTWRKSLLASTKGPHDSYFFYIQAAA